MKNIKKSMMIIIYVFIIFLILNNFYKIKLYDYSKNIIKFAGWMLIISYVFGAFCWYKITKRYFSPYFIFYCSCFLFNAGQVLLYNLDLDINNYFNIFENYNNLIIYKAITFQNISIILMNIGAVLAYDKKNNSDMNNKNILNIKQKKSDIINCIFWITSFVCIIYYLLKVLLRIDLDYTSYYYSTESSSLIYIFQFLFYASFTYRMFYYEKNNKVTNIIGIIMVILMLLVGSRYKIVPLLSILLYKKINVNNFKLKKSKLILYIILIVLGISLMRGFTLLRNYSLSEISSEKIKSVYKNGVLSGLFDTLAETGASLRCLNTTIMLVDNKLIKTDSSILYSIVVAIFPQRIVNYFGYNLKISSMSNFITLYSKSSDGLGFSIFAEIYYNFKEYGVLFMFVLGYLLVKFENVFKKLLENDDRILNFIACEILYILFYSSFLARADMILLSSDIRLCLYTCILYMIWNLKRKREGTEF